MKKGEKSMKKIKIKAEVFLCMKPSEELFWSKYLSSKSEKTHLKGIPMKLYKTAMKIFPSHERRIRFKSEGKSVCKEFAETFSISYWSSFYLYLGGAFSFFHKPVLEMSSSELAAAEVSWEITREALELASKKRRTILAGGKWEADW